MPGFMAGAARSEQVDLGVWAFLVLVGEKRILFDGGLVDDSDITHRFVEQSLGPTFGYTGADETAVKEALASNGLAPADIDVYVVSHLHHDHAGALGWLPRAKVWVHTDEIRVLDSPYVKNLIPDWQVTPGTRRALDGLVSDDRLVSWDGERFELCDGVTLFRVGGHTKGSVALVGQVEPDWRVGLLGDLVLTELQLVEGAVPAAALDAYETIRSVAVLVESADELWPGHAVDGSVLSSKVADSWPTVVEWRKDD